MKISNAYVKTIFHADVSHCPLYCLTKTHDNEEKDHDVDTKNPSMHPSMINQNFLFNTCRERIHVIWDGGEMESSLSQLNPCNSLHV